MARKQFLQNVRTTKEYSPEVIAQAELKYGEVAVFQNTKKPSLGIKVGENTYAQFKDSEAVTAEITSAKTELSKTISEHTTKIGELETKFDGYATTGALATAKTELTADYDGKFTAIKGEGYTSGTTLKSLSDAIDSLKGDSDTTVGAVASRVTEIEGILGKNVNEGLRKDVADLKTTVGDSTTGLVKDVADLKTKDTDLNKKIDAVSGASSAYTDSQIKAIKGGDGTTTATLSSLKSDVDNQGSAISGITNGTKLDSFKDVEDEINSKISSVYKVRGTKDTYADLPTEGNTIGDVYNVKAANGNTPAGTNSVCTASAGTREEQWDALGGTIDLSGYVSASSFNTLEQTVTGHTTDITNLKESASTLNTDVQTIKGWKINDKFISGSPILNGTDIKVDDAEGAQTLNVAIAAAKTAGDNAMNYAIGVSGSVETLDNTVTTNKTTIDAYTVNGTPISKNPVLTGENVKVDATAEAITLKAAIAEAKAAGTGAQDNLNTLKGSYNGTLDTLSNKVNTNEQSITDINGKLNTVESTANSAVQTITVTNTGTNGIKAEKTGTTVTFNFDNMVIDCGEF